MNEQSPAGKLPAPKPSTNMDKNGEVKHKHQYNLRPATKRDIPRLADIATRAFNDEPIDAQWFPWKDLYPRDYHRAYAEELTMWMVMPGHLVMVVDVEVGDRDLNNKDKTGEANDNAEKSGEDSVGKEGKKIPRDGKESEKNRHVVAYAVFVKYGPKKEDLVNWSPDSVTKKIDRAIFNIKTAITSRLCPNRAIYPEAYKIYSDQATEAFKKNLDSPFDQQRWIDCRGLAVDPEYQRHGYGEKLLEWLGYAAWREDVPVFGYSTGVALPLYLKNGCRIIGKIELGERVVDGRKGRGVVNLPAAGATLLMWRA